MDNLPRVLYVNTTLTPLDNFKTKFWDATIDYHEYDKFPKSLRKIERLFRVDFFLALHVKKIAHKFDIVFAGSEKVGIPLAFMKLDRPLITVVHHIASIPKKKLMLLAKPHRRWHRIGYLSNADHDCLQSVYSVNSKILFRYIYAPLAQFRPNVTVGEGPIVSVGTSKRDYQTLIAAMRELPQYRIEIYPSSQFFDRYKDDLSHLPEWIDIEPHISQQELALRYATAPFVVLPLLDTTQYSAGVSTALEAASAGKAVIATHTKGMPDYVVDGVTGILVPPGDRQALRDAIRKLKENHQLAQEMGCNARKYVEEHFDPMNTFSSTRQVIRSIFK